MKTVKEVSALCGVSVRTLHHYHAIGLLVPTAVTEAGYRLYDDDAVARLRSILLFRALRFSLAEIKTMLAAKDFSPAEALAAQLQLLRAQRDHTERLIKWAEEMQQKGDYTMPMPKDLLADSVSEQYKQEALQRWGSTDAYKQQQQKAAAGKDMNAAGEALMALFAALGKLKHKDPAENEVKQAAAVIQAYITANFYTCTDEIFRSLGAMYTEDARFAENIDKAGGEGTAAFARKAIEAYLADK